MTTLPRTDPAAADRPQSLRSTLNSDLATLAALKGARWPSAVGLIDLLLLPGTWATILFRVSCYLHRIGLRPLSRLLYFSNCVVFGADLAPGAVVGPGLVMPHPVGVAIAPGVRIGARARLMGGVRVGGGGYDDRTRDGNPVIGDDCWLLDGAKVMGPVHVGDRVVLGASALAIRDLPSDVIAAGIPARTLRRRERVNGAEVPPTT